MHAHGGMDEVRHEQHDGDMRAPHRSDGKLSGGLAGPVPLPRRIRS